MAVGKQTRDSGGMRQARLSLPSPLFVVKLVILPHLFFLPSVFTASIYCIYLLYLCIYIHDIQIYRYTEHTEQCIVYPTTTTVCTSMYCTATGTGTGTAQRKDGAR